MVACYVEDPTQRLPGQAYTWWTRKSLPLLRKQLDALNVPLLCMRGSFPNIAKVLMSLTSSSSLGVTSVYVNRRWGGSTAAEDESFESILAEKKVPVCQFTAHTIHEPWEVKTGQEKPYRVFTPFSKHFTAMKPQLLDVPPKQESDPHVCEPLVSAFQSDKNITLLDWAHTDTPYDPEWARDFPWKPGCKEAENILNTFLEDKLGEYDESRDIPFENGTSQLSPYLAHGEISPHRVLYLVRKTRSQLREKKNSRAVDSANTFEREVIWREFQYHLLYHEPDLAKVNHNTKFDTFPWIYPATDKEIRENLRNMKPTYEILQRLKATAALECWKSGHTGIPIVDAGMRQLWKIGWMHNRVRMLVASLFTKNLHFHWILGEQWFWDTLVDADPANNPGNWQWVAGTGADAAPFFRIFNPARQNQGVDDSNAYVRSWVPELKSVPTDKILKTYERTSLDQDDMGLLANASPASTWAKALRCCRSDAFLASDTTESGGIVENKMPLFRPSLIASPEPEYRAPIVNLKESRATALAYFKARGKESNTSLKDEVERPTKAARHS